MEQVMWLLLGATVLVAAVVATRTPAPARRALLVGRWALGLLFVVFGAGVNAAYLAADSGYYDDFASASPFGFVRDTWASLVVPNQWFFISLLIVGELVAGVLVVLGGRWTRAALVALMTFHVGLLAFGGALWVWAPLMLIALGLLLRAERAVERQVRGQETPLGVDRPPLVVGTVEWHE